MIAEKDRKKAKKYLANMMYDLHSTKMIGEKYVLYGFFVYKGGNEKYHEIYEFVWDIQSEFGGGNITNPQIFLTVYNILKFIAENPTKRDNPSETMLKKWHKQKSEGSLEKVARRYGKRKEQIAIPDPLEVSKVYQIVLKKIKEDKRK